MFFKLFVQNMINVISTCWDSNCFVTNTSEAMESSILMVSAMVQGATFCSLRFETGRFVKVPGLEFLGITTEHLQFTPWKINMEPKNHP